MNINRIYSKKADFLYALDSFKSSLRSNLFDCSDIDAFWPVFKDSKNTDAIMNSIIEPVLSNNNITVQSNQCKYLKFFIDL